MWSFSRDGGRTTGLNRAVVSDSGNRSAASELCVAVDTVGFRLREQGVPAPTAQLNSVVIRLTMNEFQLISDSFGTGHHGDYLADLEERLHVVVECFLFATPFGTAGVEAVHKQVARQGMDERFKRNEEYFTNLKRNVIADPDRFMNAVDPSKLGPSDRWCIKYEIDNATSSLVDVDDFVREFTYAFTDPPYGIRSADNDEKRTICSQTMKQLFGDLSDFTIRKWSTDWSNYFDAGNEWWGAFLWTLIADDGRGWWIGASTTD